MRVGDLDLLVGDLAIAGRFKIFKPLLALEPGRCELDTTFTLTTCEGVAKNLDFSETSHG